MGEGTEWRSTEPQDRRLPPRLLRYGLAVGSVALGTLAAFLLDRYQFRGVEYPLFLFAIAVTVWYAGVGPAILAVVLSSLSFNYLFTEPRYSLYVAPGDIPYYLIFILFACLLTWFSAVRRRVEQQLLESRDRLQREIVERTQQASLLNLTHDTIFVRDMNDIITYWNRGLRNSTDGRRTRPSGSRANNSCKQTFLYRWTRFARSCCAPAAGKASCRRQKPTAPVYS